jgi:hypothetical protein
MPEMIVKDKNTQDLFYIQEELATFKDVAHIYSDQTKEKKLYTIKADSIVELIATYAIYDGTSNELLGSVKQEGVKSLLKASFSFIDTTNKTIFVLKEGNPWIKFFDAVIAQIPIINIFTGYFLNPEYVVYNLQNTPVFKIKKMPSFFESQFMIESLDETISEQDEKYVVLGLLMIILIERVNV